MAKDEKNEILAADDVIGSANDETESTDGAAENEGDFSDEEVEDDKLAAGNQGHEQEGGAIEKDDGDQTDAVVGDDGDPVQIVNGVKGDSDVGDEADDNEEELEKVNDQSEEVVADDQQSRSSSRTSRQDGDEQEDSGEPSRPSSSEPRPSRSKSRPSSENSRPSSSKSRPSSQAYESRPSSAQRKGMSEETNGSKSPRPSSNRSSRRSPAEEPLKWPYSVIYLSDHDNEATIGCVIRSNDDIIGESGNLFTCRLVPHLGTFVVGDSEELISDVILIEDGTSTEDNSVNGGVSEQRDDDEKVDEQVKEQRGDGEMAENGNDVTVAKETMESGEGRLDNDNHKFTPLRQEYRLVVGIRYTITPRMMGNREIIVKRRDDDTTWTVLPSLSIDSSFQEHKGPFVEVRVNRPGVFAVVARPLTDRVTITKKGGLLKSSIDSRISVTYPEGISSLMSAALRVQPAEHAVSELKTYMRHCSDLIAASPILHLTHSTKKPFDHPVTVALSCPPNPYKAKAAIAKVEEREEKSSKATIPPPREDAVIIRSTKSSIFGGDPEKDVLHLLHRSVISKSWTELHDVNIRQIRKDVVEFNIHRPYDRLLVLRMPADCRYPVENVANTFEQALQIKFCKIILAHKAEDLELAMVFCVPVRQVEGVIRKLAADGYEAPSEMSRELPLTEGMEIEMRATGNIQVVNHKAVRFVFHSQRRNVIGLRLDYTNKYGNYGSTDYRGMFEFYGIPRIELHDMEDPEEILLREAEAKVEAKKRGRARGKKEKEAKEHIKNVKNAPNDLLCKLPVALPKRDNGTNLTKAAHSRAEVADVPGVASNDNCRWLASELGNEWESLVTYMGIQPSRLQSIKRNSPDNQEAQIFNALVTWRSRLPKSYDKDQKLLRALTKCGRYDLAEELKS